MFLTENMGQLALLQTNSESKYSHFQYSTYSIKIVIYTQWIADMLVGLYSKIHAQCLEKKRCMHNKTQCNSNILLTKIQHHQSCSQLIKLLQATH